jgi:hypothetical protein
MNVMHITVMNLVLRRVMELLMLMRVLTVINL